MMNKYRKLSCFFNVGIGKGTKGEDKKINSFCPFSLKPTSKIPSFNDSSCLNSYCFKDQCLIVLDYVYVNFLFACQSKKKKP